MRLNLKLSIQTKGTMNKSILLIPLFLLLLNNVSLAQITAESDSLFYRQKKLFDKLGVFKAWEVTKGNTETVIGCIDNGFDFYHPYLYSQLIPGYYVDKSYHPMTFSTMAHGTLVSSLIVAKPNTEKGMHGLVPIVTSLAALVYSIAPRMSAGEVKRVIIQGCDDIGEKGFDIYTGPGRINFGKTISLVLNRDVK